MWKQLSALLRGQSYEAAERVVDRNGLVILRQQIRDCAEAVTMARKALAFAIVQNEGEEQTYRKLLTRIEDLEGRTIAALESGKTELAREAAETIAVLETERAASDESRKMFAAEIERLKRIVAGAEIRLRDLQRGQRVAAAVEQTQRLRQGAPGTSLSTLGDAEETLARLRERQKGADAFAALLEEAEGVSDPAAISRKLAAAGCGAPVRNSAEAVLERLSKRTNPAAS